MRFSKNIVSLVPSATLAISARAKKMRAAGESVIDLSAGEPSFPTPEVGIEAGVAYVRSGKAGYPPTPGIQPLRAAVASYVNETTAHAQVEPANVLISAGVKQALFNASFCLFESGDEVLVPAPYWPTYQATIELAKATPVVVPTDWENGFRIDIEALERLRSPTTRGLLLNSPSNPSGPHGRPRTGYGSSPMRYIGACTTRETRLLRSLTCPTSLAASCISTEYPRPSPCRAGESGTP
jgi:aspartate aminotransferase